MAFAKLLDQRVGEQLEGTDAELLARLTGAATRLDRMLTGMIEHAQLLKRTAERAPTDVDALAGQAVRRFELGVDRDKLPDGTRLTLDASAGAEVVTDGALVEIILTELLANAIEAARPDEPHLVEIRLRHEADALRIEVTDNGVGMDTDHLDRAVKLFGRLVTASQRPGTGIGLTLAQDAVDLLGGTLTHTPVEPTGSTFTVNLPD